MSTQEILYQSLGLSEDIINDKVKFIQLARKGLSGEVVRQAVIALDNRDVLVRVLRTTSGNLHRVYHRKAIDTVSSEEVLDTIHLYGEAARIFGDLETAKSWLKTPLTALSGESPEALFDTFKGREWVGQTLRKIEYGEFT